MIAQTKFECDNSARNLRYLYEDDPLFTIKIVGMFNKQHVHWMQIHFVARTDSGSRHQEDAHQRSWTHPRNDDEYLNKVFHLFRLSNNMRLCAVNQKSFFFLMSSNNNRFDGNQNFVMQLPFS